jgi:hypothetical protein
MYSDVRIEQGSEHHGDHESRKNVAQWKGSWFKRGFLQRWDPYEDKQIHGPFKNCLRQAKDEEDRVYIRYKPEHIDEKSQLYAPAATIFHAAPSRRIWKRSTENVAVLAPPPPP